MKNTKVLQLTLALVLLVMLLPTALFADANTQAEPFSLEPFPPSILMGGDEIPPVEGGSPYRYPIIPTQVDQDILEPAAPEDITIDVWYGLNQTFGQLGVSQDWFNILGNVSGPNPITELSYSVNGEPSQLLNIGPDTRRLYGTGDFNIELQASKMIPGENEVIIKAKDGIDEVTQKVTVNYIAGNTWPLLYTADWSAMGGNILNGASVVDGLWEISDGKLKNSVPGYDRLVAIGDYKWANYEVTVPINVKSLNTAEWGPPSNGAGVGILVGWRGHTKTSPDEQPGTGWRRLGALAWFRWAQNGSSTFQINGNGGGILVQRNDAQIELEKDYIFKLSVQSASFSGQSSTYRFKFWEQGEPEPVEWYMTTFGKGGEPPTGSLLLVAHQAMVEFGNVEVVPLPAGPFTITKQAPNDGQIIIDPDKPSYNYGERVQIRALGNSGFGLSKWKGSFTGDQNPLVFDITRNLTVGAEFAPAPAPTLNISTSGQGSVTKDPSKGSYLSGELVTLTPNPQPGYIFGGWSGDLTGADNPAVIVMDTSKNITASFVQTNANSPKSDDFNACDLDTNLWTFVNPVGDGSYSINGTDLLITVPADVSHNIWQSGNFSARMMQATQNSNFEIKTKFNSTVTTRYQMQGILIEEDNKNFLRFEVHYDGGAPRLFAASFTNGVPETRLLLARLAATPSHLRVTRVNDQWGFSYSNDGLNWQSVGSFVHKLTVAQSGVFAGNHGTPPLNPIPAHTAVVDYFFNSASPISPEDGNPINDFSITVNTIGEGTVTLDPFKDSYQCNEAVTVTAVPATGWNFASWSGDLSGSSLQQNLVMTKNYQFTATFTQSANQIKLYLPMTIK